MNKNEYIIEITKEEKNICGRFQILQKGLKAPKTYDFSPSNVLCDLKIFEHISEINDEDVIFTGYDFEYAFGIAIYINKHNSYYYPFAQMLQERINSNEQISLKELEKVRQFFNINLNYSISYKERSSLYEILKNKKKIQEFTYTPLQYGHCKIEKLFNKEDDKSHIYIYTCYNIAEIVFAVLHYLTINGYSNIKRCNHCGKLFYYKHLSEKYCKRKSPYENYVHLDCEQAVRNIKKKLSDRNKSIRTNLDNYYFHNLDNYLNNWYVYKDIVDECSSVENLKKLEEFTSPENIKSNYYINKS